MMRILVVTLAVIGGTTNALGQVIGPGGGPIAPGPSQPHDYVPGGIGPGGVPVAPGPAARDMPIERIGPGGGRLAPGPAGSVGTGPTLRLPEVAPSSGGLRGTVRTKRQRPHRGRTPSARR